MIVDHAAAISHFERSSCNFSIVLQPDDLPKQDIRETFETIACSDPFCNRCCDLFDDSQIEDDRSRVATKGVATALMERCTLDETIDTLTQDSVYPQVDEVYMLLTSKVFGYSLRNHRWYPLHLHRLTEIRSSADSFNDVVLPATHKQVIQAFVQSQIGVRAQKSRNDLDLISMKRGGSILLFHGAPGTGKLSAAEAIAKQLHSPLLYITYADLGTNLGEIKSQLTSFLSLAERWSCILGLGGADILLARTGSGDMERTAVQHGWFPFQEHCRQR